MGHGKEHDRVKEWENIVVAERSMTKEAPYTLRETWFWTRQIVGSIHSGGSFTHPMREGQ